MIEKDQNYFINNPVFVKFKDRFEIKNMSRVRRLKSVHVNERIVEIPFVIESLKELKNRGKVLDLGCTESVIPLHLASLGYQVTGLDFRKYPYHHPNLTAVQGNILELPFDDQGFDAVLCISTLEHIGLGFYTDPTQTKAPDQLAVEQVFRVLKKDGLFLLTVPFGVPQITKQQRFYDYAMLEKLLNKFEIQEAYFFATRKDPNTSNNYWASVSKEEASMIKSQYGAECVCLIKSKK